MGNWQWVSDHGSIKQHRPDTDIRHDRIPRGVSQWDVSVERQVEISGQDAAHLAQLLSVRDLSKIEVGKGKYVPMCDHRGVLINDPVVPKHEDGTFWLSIGDNNILMWSRRSLAIGCARRNISGSHPPRSMASR